jgi:heptosyltransferase-1
MPRGTSCRTGWAPVPDFRRILIVKLTALGDILHALPAVTYLRGHAPSAEIHWAVDARFADLLKGAPGIARVVPLPIKEWRDRAWSPAAWKGAFGAVTLLRRERYDVAFDIQGNIKSGVVTCLSGAPVRYGFSRETARERQNAWFTNRRPEASASDRHVTQKILRVVSAPFGGGFDFPGPEAELAITPAEVSEAGRLLSDTLPGAAPRLALHPGTTWSTKRMDPSFWADAVRILRESRPTTGTFLSWGTETEREDCLAIRDRAGGQVALLPRLRLRELAAVYRACGYVLGPDTGPLHLAAAAGARTVSVFRATDGNRNAPTGPGHRFLQAPLPCTACLRKACDRDAECRASLRAADAAAAMGSLMENGRS